MTGWAWFWFALAVVNWLTAWHVQREWGKAIRALRGTIDAWADRTSEGSLP